MKLNKWTVGLALFMIIFLAGCSRKEEEPADEVTEVIAEETEVAAEPLDLSNILVTADDTPERHDGALHPANTEDEIYCYYCYITQEGGKVSPQVFESHRHDVGVDEDNCYICQAYKEAWESADYSLWHLAYVNQFAQVSTTSYTGTTYDSKSTAPDGLIAIYLGDLDGETGDELLLVYLEDGELFLRAVWFAEDGVIQRETTHRVADTMYNGENILSAPYEDLAVYVIEGGGEGAAVVVEYSFGNTDAELKDEYPDYFAYQLACYQFDGDNVSVINNYVNRDGIQQQVSFDTVYSDIDGGVVMTDFLFARAYETNARQDAVVLAVIRTQEDLSSGAVTNAQTALDGSVAYPTQVDIRDRSDLYWIGHELELAADYVLQYAEEEEDIEANSIEETAYNIAHSALNTFLGDPVPNDAKAAYVETVTVDGEEFYKFLVTFIWEFESDSAKVEICYWYYSVYGQTDWYEEIDGWQQAVADVVLPYIGDPGNEE